MFDEKLQNYSESRLWAQLGDDFYGSTSPTIHPRKRELVIKALFARDIDGLFSATTSPCRPLLVSVWVYSRFPDGFPGKTFPGKSFPGWSFSRIRRFPERRFPDGHFSGKTFPGGHFPGWDHFLWLIYRRTLNMNNTLYKFIPRRKANCVALLTPQGYAKCQMLIFHHSSKTYELRNIQGSIKLHLFRLSYPDLVL